MTDRTPGSTHEGTVVERRLVGQVFYDEIFDFSGEEHEWP